MGKITIIKTLAISQLINLLSVLPSPNKNILDEIYKILKDFIWDGKKPKLSWETLSLEVEKGGLKLTNLKLFIHGLKISWIKKLQNKGTWQHLFQETICEDKTLIWKLDEDSLMKMSKSCKNRFWKEVLNSWRYYKAHSKTDKLSYNCVSGYPIWHTYWNINRNIHLKKPQFIEKNIKYIKDLLNGEGVVYNHREFANVTGININFLDYYSLIQLKEGTVQDYQSSLNYIDPYFRKIISLPKVSKNVYNALINQQIMVRNHENKREEILQVNFDWRSTYKLIKEVTMEANLQEFQYEIVHRILPTNKFLHMCNIVPSNKCYFCDQEIETLIHIFFDCIHIMALWKDISDWLSHI